MKGRSTYNAARTVAKAVENHFAQHRGDALQRGEKVLAPLPQASVIESVIDAAFWASLRREEGISPKISLAFLPPELAGQPLLFEKPLPLTSGVLTKLGPGVERAGIHLGVWFEKNELFIWGTTLEIQSYSFVLDVPEPGLLVIKHRRIDRYGKFANVAVLKGDQIKIIDEQSSSLPKCPKLLTSLLGFTDPASWNESVNVLVLLAVSMRAHGRGGTLLVVPKEGGSWRDSIVKPMQYAITPVFPGLANLMRQDENERNRSFWQRSLRREIDNIAGLTAIDGAVIISNQFELLAFGAKITRPAEALPVEQMVVTEPVVGNKAIVVNPAQHGGTRHLSAAQFVHDQREAMALVASQDGRFTIFAWSPCENKVHAHRIDTLLL
ncbi:putative sensor domain DACNV-containing protein [Adhaeribacter terreus]|uniref:Sensor domain DACNV-containing protein n=1 Tax=Adhaeribacter terreus TaxID=529703 RepID=A0ABW0EGZ2_9BACT